MPKKQKYIRPFAGIPAPLPMSGLFLFSPSVDMKLLGAPMRSTFADLGKESLFKRMQALQQENAQPAQDTLTPSAQDTLRELLTVLPDAPFRRLMADAFEGDTAALNQVQSLGLWEACLYDQWAVPDGKLRPQPAFILAIERACKEPERLVRQRQFGAAAAELSAHPVMREFLWPEALHIFSSAEQPLDLLPLRLSVALEIRLCLIALVDVSVACAAGNPTVSYFTRLIPSNEESGMNPTSLFFHWLKDEVGAETIESLLDNDAAGTGGVANTTTLKRWSNGSHQPSEAWLNALAHEHFGDTEHELLWDMYWASRYLNFIGYTAESVRERALQIEPEHQILLAPWPRLPFDCASISVWLKTRYPLWLQYHWQRASESI